MAFQTGDEARAYIAQVAEIQTADIDLAETALALATLSHPGISIDKYRHHLTKLIDAARESFDTALEEEEDTAVLRARILHDVIIGQFDYEGDQDTYDDLQNGDLMRVIDRRRGLPVALGILYINTARGLDWSVFGLRFPGHFLLRLEKDSDRVIIDPFYGRYDLSAAELRDLLKDILGKEAELSHEFYDAVDSREILIRLQNNIKTRLIESEDYSNALSMVQNMISIDPNEHRLLLDSGVLHAKLGDKDQAVNNLQDYINHLPEGPEKQDMRDLITQIEQNRF